MESKLFEGVEFEPADVKSATLYVENEENHIIEEEEVPVKDYYDFPRILEERDGKVCTSIRTFEVYQLDGEPINRGSENPIGVEICWRTEGEVGETGTSLTQYERFILKTAKGAK